MGRRHKKRIGPAAMRRQWRALGLEDPIDNGYVVLQVHVRKCGRGTPPDCVYTEILAYIDSSGREIARAERHLRVDGSVGASGKADPKRILIDDTLYILH
jgi:hypothetical protein